MGHAWVPLLGPAAKHCTNIQSLEILSSPLVAVEDWKELGGFSDLNSLVFHAHSRESEFPFETLITMFSLHLKEMRFKGFSPQNLPSKLLAQLTSLVPIRITDSIFSTQP